MRLNLGTAVLIVVVCLHQVALAIDFDFESTPLGAYQGSLSVNSGGLGLTVTSEGNPAGFVHALNGGMVGMGNVGVIANNQNPLAGFQFLPLRFTFSQLVKDITFLFGDSGGDADSPVTIDAYSSAGILLGSLNSVYPENQSVAGSVGGSFAGAKYFIASSGSVIDNHNSLFWEMRGVTPVPEPATQCLVKVLLLAGAGLSRRSRRRCA